ncbi:MAG: arsenate reductase [Burkholderiales bacterium]
MPAIRIYGIANCDKVKRARAWFAANGIPAEFHDFRKHGIDRSLLARWLGAHEWSEFLNRSGTTWRRLPQTRRAAVTSRTSAAALMLEFPALIRRPVIEHAGKVRIGFDPGDYARH